MDINPSEVTKILKEQIKKFGDKAEVTEVGQVLSVGDGIARVYGLDNVQAGEMVEFADGSKGMALNLESENVGVVIFGRIANFINAELYGNPTNVFWSVIFPTIDEIPRHPSQIYEALLEGVLLFVINIFIILNKKIKTGVCASVFLILYGIFRIVGEQFRAPDIQVGYIFGVISMGSILSFTMIVSGIFLLIKVNK